MYKHACKIGPEGVVSALFEPAAADWRIERNKVVQMAGVDNERFLLTGDIGPDDLNEAADYAIMTGLMGRSSNGTRGPFTERYSCRFLRAFRWGASISLMFAIGKQR
jgi:hypothetical protein